MLPHGWWLATSLQLATDVIAPHPFVLFSMRTLGGLARHGTARTFNRTRVTVTVVPNGWFLYRNVRPTP
jgi:hypothetical protein